MGRKATGRTTKLMRVPIQFEEQVKALIQQLKAQQQQQTPRRGVTAPSCNDEK